MDLSVGFTCPRCDQTTEQNLNDYSPGRQRICNVCRTPTELTRDNLNDLAAKLENSCRP